MAGVMEIVLDGCRKLSKLIPFALSLMPDISVDIMLRIQYLAGESDYTCHVYTDWPELS